MATRNSTAKGLVQAAAYYRMSSDKQEASIPAQRKAVERQLQSLDDRLLADIGLHRSDIQATVWK